MKRFLIALLLLAFLGGAVSFFLVFPWGPRMIDQPHVSTYERSMPLPPAGAVPLADHFPGAPTPAEGAAFSLPPATPENLRHGAVVYGYYCVFCHGADGAGHGTVGVSYIPTPTDLRSPRVTALSDADLLRAMLTGPGHEPILARIVPPRYRGWLALHVRALGKVSVPPRFDRESEPTDEEGAVRESERERTSP